MILVLMLTARLMAQDFDPDAVKAVEKKFVEPPRFGSEITVKKFRYPYSHLPVNMDLILASPIIQKALISGGSIQQLSDDSTKAITKRIYVNVYQLTDENGFFYIIEKNGQLKRRVHSKHALSMTADVEMYEQPRLFSEVKERRNISPFDRQLIWRPEFIINLNRGQSNWTSDILGESKSSSSSGYQLGTRFMMDMSNRFQIGLSAFFENSQMNLTGGEANYKNISFGVTAKSPQIDWGGFASRFFIDGRYGPSGSLQVTSAGQSGDIDMQSTTLQLGWERTHQNRWGEFMWGATLQRDWPKLRNQKVYIAQDSSESTNDSIGIHISQGLPW